MNFRELIYSKQFFGSGGSGKLEEITITENGVYEPLKEVVIGGTYKFKDHYTREDFEAITGGSTWFGFISDYENDVGLYISSYQGGYRLNYYAAGTYSWGYCYITEDVVDSVYPTSGWYNSLGNTDSAPTPTITMPDTTSGYKVELSEMKPLFDMTQADGYNKVIVDVPEAELVELTVTESGVYEPIVKFEPGGTYKFKDSYTRSDFEAIMNGSTWLTFVSDYSNNFGLYIESYNGGYSLNCYAAGTYEWGYRYITEDIVDSTHPTSGWYSHTGNFEKVPTPVVTLPADTSGYRVELSQMEPLFNITQPDGFKKVTVNVETNLANIIVDKNGVYKPSVEPGGTYTFKDSYTNEELKILFESGTINGTQSIFIQDQNNNMALVIINNGNGLYVLQYCSMIDQSWAFAYITDSVVATGALPVSTSGWVNMITMENVDAPTITIPTDTSVLWAYPSSFASFFGGSFIYDNYTFKDRYTNEELRQIYLSFGGETPPKRVPLISTEEGVISISNTSNTLTDRSRFVLDYISHNEDSGYVYVSEEVYNSGLISIDAPGWGYYDTPSHMPNVNAPTITFSNPASEILVNTSILNLIFTTNTYDGFKKVTVNVPTGATNLGKIVVSQNGTYIPQTEVQLGGTYTFKEHYTDEELSTLFSLGRIDGSHSYYLMNEYQFTIAKEEYNGAVGYGIYADGGLYVGEQASKHYTNGVPGWYAYSASQRCSPPSVVMPTSAEELYAPLEAFNKVFVVCEGYNEVVVEAANPQTMNTEEEMDAFLLKEQANQVYLYTGPHGKYDNDQLYISQCTPDGYVWRKLEYGDQV